MLQRIHNILAWITIIATGMKSIQMIGQTPANPKTSHALSNMPIFSQSTTTQITANVTSAPAM